MDFKSDASKGQSDRVLEGERGNAIVFPLYKLKYADYLLSIKQYANIQQYCIQMVTTKV